MMSRTNRGQRGATGSMLAVGICLSLASVFLVAAVLINWFTLARGAEQSAELAALAGASASVAGESPCDAAKETARRNATTLDSCVVRGAGSRVVVEVSIVTALRPALPFGLSVMRREATAGTA